MIWLAIGCFAAGLVAGWVLGYRAKMRRLINWMLGVPKIARTKFEHQFDSEMPK